MNWILDLPLLNTIQLSSFVFYGKRGDFDVEMKSFAT